MSKSPDHIANPLRNTWRYRIAAWLTGGTVYEFQSHVGNSEWKRGLCILSPEAFDAHISYVETLNDKSRAFLSRTSPTDPTPPEK